MSEFTARDLEPPVLDRGALRRLIGAVRFELQIADDLTRADHRVDLPRAAACLAKIKALIG